MTLDKIRDNLTFWIWMTRKGYRVPRTQNVRQIEFSNLVVNNATTKTIITTTDLKWSYVSTHTVAILADTGKFYAVGIQWYIF